jgi:hypothetical protein
MQEESNMSFTPYQQNFYNQNKRQFAGTRKGILFCFLQVLFCVLVGSQLFYEYSAATRNWLYFLSVAMVSYNSLGCFALLIVYFGLCVASWADVTDNFGFGKKVQNTRMRIIRLILVEKNVAYYIDVINDIALFVIFVSLGYPFLAVFHAASIGGQQYLLKLCSKKIEQFIECLEDPFDGEDEDIDQLADKLFHGEGK